MQGITEVKVTQLKKVKEDSKCDVLALSESASSSSEPHRNAEMKDLLIQSFPECDVHSVPCNCIPDSKFAGRHGITVIAHKELKSSFLYVPLKGCNGYLDHRQLCVDLTAKNGAPIRMVAVHYKSNAGTLSEITKRLQCHSTIDILKDAEDGTVLIAGGDFNVHPEWPIFGEVVKLFNTVGMTCSSVLDIWNNDLRGEAWTHRQRKRDSGNMIDHVFVSSHVDCFTQLLGPPDYNVTTDHEKFIELSIFDSLNVSVRQVHLGRYRCEECGRVYRYEGRIHNPCPYNLDELVQTYKDKLLCMSDKSGQSSSVRAHDEHYDPLNPIHVAEIMLRALGEGNPPKFERASKDVQPEVEDDWIPERSTPLTKAVTKAEVSFNLWEHV